ncbi:redox-regulated ATPase YchF [Candidatus Micrarchaeota archaeon CG10_big_fil_rev_8_21_14_0_10_59_7]|nr:MAG: redox-regulated ATPase YchF [Candidatus Micrarchaeota archaeon CG10_big_fil_rev_8_21_14_0_10_59_7]
MLIGIVGLPNKGKSTLFNALTRGHAAVANYPFTTIDPNKGVAFLRVKCPCAPLGKQCSPRTGACNAGERDVPVNVVDVAGLVEGAHAGHGRGNQFLADLSQADALICVADASGGTDGGGNPAKGHDPAEDVRILESEIDYWFLDVIRRNLLKARGRNFSDFAACLSGIRVSEEVLRRVSARLGMTEEIATWKEEKQLLSLAQALRKETKPVAIAANKMDLPGASEGLARLKEAFPNYVVIPAAADAELALQKAKELGMADYDGKRMTIREGIPPKLADALHSIDEHVLKKGGTGVHEILNTVAFDLLRCVVAYPVEDEKHLSDHFGKVLPDAILLPPNSTAHQLAAAIHTDLATHFLYALNARTGMRISKDHVIADGDVIKIVSAK